MEKRIGHSVAIFLLIALLAVDVSASGSIVFSPDGKLVAVGKRSGAIELRASETGNLLTTFNQLETPPDPLSAVNWRPKIAFSPDGDTLASASGYSPVVLWDVKRREKIKSLPVISVGYDLSFSSDGSLLVGIGVDSKAGPHRLTLWSIQSGKPIRSLAVEMRLESEHASNRIRRAHFPASGGVLAIETLEDGIPLVRLWDTKTGEETVKIHAEAWDLSPDGKYVLARTAVDKTGRTDQHTLWDVNSGKVVKTIPAKADDQRAEQQR